VRLGPTPITNRGAITNVIDGLTANGSTAGAAGLTLAYQQARAGFIEGGINHIEAIVNQQATRDADRAEFASLFAKAKALLGP